MALPAEKLPSVEDAIAELRRNPQRVVRAKLDDLEIEIRVSAPRRPEGPGLGTQMAALGPWQGESTEEILKILEDARRQGGSSPPPEMP